MLAAATHVTLVMSGVLVIDLSLAVHGRTKRPRWCTARHCSRKVICILKVTNKNMLELGNGTCLSGVLSAVKRTNCSFKSVPVRVHWHKPLETSLNCRLSNLYVDNLLLPFLCSFLSTPCIVCSACAFSLPTIVFILSACKCGFACDAPWQFCADWLRTACAVYGSSLRCYQS